MPTIVVHYDIKDKVHWLASPKRKELFGRARHAGGVVGVARAATVL
jgi:hypothetical protein